MGPIIENGRRMNDVVVDVAEAAWAGVGEMGACFDSLAARLRAISRAANLAKFCHQCFFPNRGLSSQPEARTSWIRRSASSASLPGG